MRILFIISFFLLSLGGIAVQAQTKAEKDRAKLENMMEEKKLEYINNIVDGFEELDEFQRHILTQKLQSYYDELQKIYQLDIPIFQKKTLMDDLNATHFKDFETMLGEEFVEKLVKKVKGEDQSDQKKKKRKKKKKE